MNLSFSPSNHPKSEPRITTANARLVPRHLATALALGLMLTIGCSEATGLPPASDLCAASSPLSLGDINVRDSGPTPIELVRMSDRFVVGFQHGDIYEIHSIDAAGAAERVSVALEEPDARFAPQLIDSAEGLALFYEAGDSVHRVILTDSLTPGPVEEFWSMTPGSPYSHTWRAVAHEDDRVRIVSEAYVLGYNGSSYIRVLPLGHGQWQIRGDDPSPFAEHPINPSWLGFNGGITGGASLASTPETGRHAGVFADAGSQLIIALEGAEAIEVPMDQTQLQASMAWDGRSYPIVFTAEDEASQRDLHLMQVSPDTLAITPAMERVVITDDALDNHSPVVRAAGIGDYGVAWVREGQVIFQQWHNRCTD